MVKVIYSSDIILSKVCGGSSGSQTCQLVIGFNDCCSMGSKIVNALEMRLQSSVNNCDNIHWSNGQLEAGAYSRGYQGNPLACHTPPS